ncbi:MAG: tetratricopeptide repeat protein [Gemmatimonadaceae bacterium]
MHKRYLAFAAAMTIAANSAGAQPPAGLITLGDQAHSSMRPAQALEHYEVAITADPTNYEALWKAARTVIDLAEFEKNSEKRTAWFATGETYARRAVEANPADAEGHFQLARGLGRVALTLGVKERIKYAKEVRAHALEALERNPDHAGALHVMGRWNAEVRRTGGFQRFMAENFLGGKVFGSASWSEARRYLEKAVALEPGRLTHHLGLGEVYADIGETAKALERFEFVVAGEAKDYNDRFYKEDAAKRLKELGSRQ